MFISVRNGRSIQGQANTFMLCAQIGLSHDYIIDKHDQCNNVHSGLIRLLRPSDLWGIAIISICPSIHPHFQSMQYLIKA